MTRVRPRSSRRLALTATFCSLIAALTLAPSRLVAQKPSEAHVANGHLNVGDLLEVRMTGELAEQYARCIGGLQDNKAPRGLEIETSAMVAQKLDDGRIRLEHSSPIRRGENQDRLLTMTAIVDPAKVKTDITPKGTPVYPSPNAAKNGTKPTTTTFDVKTLRLQLSDLKGVKLRTWALAEEIGD